MKWMPMDKQNNITMKSMEIKCYCGHTITCDCGPESNEALKLAKERYDEWDVTLMDGLEYESWDELYDDYVGEADLHEFVQWLKDNFQVPNKLGSQDL
jgi:hypothetical protein